ncbi:CENP-S associating centromere protein X-domain-containing protein [Cercophora samala]|uniref:CENP-S associating centromere protein X-domain-containing protein n=1 Tax=Cercophora samala TaxID=330535 RepID=A0AA39Z7Z7_9PEZI|nr:CENP-S associating centromere protein X-domain-containing protein [Cercophora samala]
MPPKQSTGAGGRGRPATGASKSGAASKTAANSSKRATGQTAAGANKKQKTTTLSDDERQAQEVEEEEEEDEDEEEEDERESIPPELLSKIVHELFEHKDTKITKDANNALSGYMDVFVREAIARAAAERKGGFLEVEDLEKVSPQLVLDL